jgi:beta-lactamase regulating signal transducer with metallopeptidase domain
MHAALVLPLLNHFAALSRLSSTALIAAIWQGTLLAAAAALALRLVPRIPAAARFAIWFAVFALIVALPMLQLAPRNPSQAPAAAPAHAFFSFDSRWTLAIAAVWVAASLLRAATLIAAALRVRTLARNATPIAYEFTSTPRRTQICASSDIDRPTVIGFFSPKILIPTWLLDKLTPAELDHIVLHESSHLNRADDWLNFLQKLALVLFPINPALAWVERRLCFERELACDERVLNELAARAGQSAYTATSYASSLATLAEYRLQHRGLVQNLTLALGALGASTCKSELGRRVARILTPAMRMRPLHARLATAAAIAALLFTTTELEHSPQLVSFTSAAPAAQLADVASVPGLATEQGAPPQARRTAGSLSGNYRAVAARFILPAARKINPQGDATPHLVSGPSQRAAETNQPRAIDARAVQVRATVPRQSTPQHLAVPHLISAESAPQPNLIIARYTVTEYQSADGYRVVRTSELISDAPSATVQDDPRQDVDSLSNTPDRSNGHAAPTLRARPISQPYAAVPVPGGWLVFQL